jgi:cobalt-zinc-cadmium efflux system protein
MRPTPEEQPSKARPVRSKALLQGSPGHHDHPHGHDHDTHKPAGDAHNHGPGDLMRTSMRRLSAAFACTAGFMVVEALVGFWSGSLALLADAGHMLADSAALGLAMVAQRIAAQPRTRSKTYGFRRAEVLAAFANGVALALTAIWIFGEAIERLRTPTPIHATAMTVTAGIGLLVNLTAALLLSSGHARHNVNTRAAFTHVLFDAVGSVGAMLGGVLILTLGWTRADPIISAVLGVLVLWGGWRLVRDTMRVLMEASPLEIDIAHVEDTLRSVPGVVDFHDLHIWSISDGFDVLTVHVVLEKGHHGTDVVIAVGRRLREVHGLHHCTIQPEPPHQDHLIPLSRPPRT